MSVGKRNKYEIFFDILGSLQIELSENDKPSPTRVAHKANLPYDRFQKALNELVQLGMVTSADSGLSLTEKGREFVNEFKKVNEFLRRMGF